MYDYSLQFHRQMLWKFCVMMHQIQSKFNSIIDHILCTAHRQFKRSSLYLTTMTAWNSGALLFSFAIPFVHFVNVTDNIFNWTRIKREKKQHWITYSAAVSFPLHCKCYWHISSELTALFCLDTLFILLPH